MECVILIGAQASGKSSFYRARFFRSHLRISLDMLRTRHRERRLLATCLEIRQSFVVDNTNPGRTERARYIERARAAGFRVLGYRFEAALADVLERNAQRPDNERIPEKGIRATLARMEEPRLAEGFDVLYRVRSDGSGGFTVESA